MKARLFVTFVLVLTLAPVSLQGAVAREQTGTEATTTTVITLDFEDLTDFTPVTDQYAPLGVSFAGATVLSQGGSLNYLEFPPRSGINVIYDDPAYAGVVTISFDAAQTGDVTRVGGYVTGNTNVTMTAFDASWTVLGTAETGGANYASVGDPNMLLEITSATPISFVRYTDTGNTFTVDDFFFASEQACHIPDVPLYKQSDPTWATDPYGGSTTDPWKHDDDGDGRLDEDPKDGKDNDGDERVDEDTPETISKWGCALTSAAMTVSYHGNLQTGFTTTPRDLNNWLRSHGGYSFGYLIWDKVAEYARSNGVQLYRYAGWGPDDGVVNWYLCNSLPMTLKTTSSPYTLGHFVVATGQADSSAWTVNDPGGHNLTQLATTSYDSYRKLGTTASDPSLLSISAHSPLELLVTDPAGRRAGYDPSTAQYVDEILDASYGTDALGASDGTGSSAETLVFETGAPLSGEYSVQLIGVGTGEYTIDFLAYASDGDASHATVDGVILDGTTIEFTAVYSDTPGSEIVVEQVTFLPTIYLPLVSNNSH